MIDTITWKNRRRRTGRGMKESCSSCLAILPHPDVAPAPPGFGSVAALNDRPGEAARALPALESVGAATITLAELAGGDHLIVSHALPRLKRNRLEGGHVVLVFRCG